MKLRLGLLVSTLLAGSADGRLAGKKDVGAEELPPALTTLGNKGYTGTWTMLNRSNLSMSVVVVTCVDGTCEGIDRINFPPIPGLSGRFIPPAFPFPAVLDVGPDGRGKFLPTLPPNFGGATLEFSISPKQRQGDLVTEWIGSPDFRARGLATVQQTSLISATRRAADGYSNQSLNGVYAWSSVAGNQGVYYGFATFDGEGGFTGILTSDEPDPKAAQGRAFTEGPLLGTYEVADNGFVTMTQTGAGAPVSTLFFAVTEGAPGRVDALAGSWDSPPTSQFIDSNAATIVDLSYYEPGTSIVPLGSQGYTGTWTMVNRSYLSMSVVVVTCVDGTCEGIDRINFPPIPGTSGRFIPPAFPFSAVLDVGPDGRGSFFPTLPPNFGGATLEFSISPKQRQGDLVTEWIGSPDFRARGLAAIQQTSLISATRRAADGYSNQSLNGVYAWSSVAGPNQGVYYGFATFDGEGGFTGILTSDEPDPKAAQGRAFTEGPLLGTYEVADNGFVTMTQTGAGAPVNTLFFAVTEGPPDRVDALTGSWDSPPTSQFIDSNAVTIVDLSYYEPGASSVPAPTPPPMPKATEVPTSGSIGISPEPTAGSIGISPEPTSGSIGSSPEPTAGSIGISPEPTSGSIGISPEPTAGSIGISPEPTAGSIGISPEPTPKPSAPGLRMAIA